MEQKFRLIAFGFGCVVLRSFIVALAAHLGSKLDKSWLNALVVVFVLFSMLFYRKYMKHFTQTAQVGLFGGTVWWNDMRLLHSVIYGLFGALAILNAPHAWALLLMDVVLGIVAVGHHYYN
jgi:nicotinamide riboside transporter PnuC